MAGVAIEITANDKKVTELLKRIQKKLGDLTPAMKIIGNTVRTSIVRNFEKEGRPAKWEKHSKLTEKRRGKGAKILRIQGFAAGLMGSIHSTAKKDRVIIGTDKIYAAIHQFGAKKGSFGTVEAEIKAHMRKITKIFGRPVKPRKVTVRAHTRKMKLPWGDIPARPFIMVQPEDWDEIRESLSDYILG
ncbi:phage virion morphogenesis protein [candidate division WOR-3 bacterium]|nr:phage virion morphogenesis protein [candidate division WOR-3 bacterium]